MDELMTVPVQVPKHLKDYILGINGGSEVIVPQNHSLLWATVKVHLNLVPREGLPPLNPDASYIRIAIYGNTHRRIYNIRSGKVIRHSSPLFRCHLDEEGQRAIATYLDRSFKADYRSYMSGALSNNPDLSIREAIEEFCNDRHVEMDANITYDMLRKDWYRYRKSTDDFCGRNAESI